MVVAFEREVSNRFPRVEEADDRAELQDMLRNPRETARSRLFAHLRTYRGIAQEVERQGLDTGGYMQEVRSWIDDCELGSHHNIEDHEGYSDQEIWQRERVEDLQNNFLFMDYLDTVCKRGFRNYAVHLDFRGIRAAIQLLTGHQSGESLLQELYDDDRVAVPSKEDALRFKESPEYSLSHPEAWIEAAIRAVPGIYSAGHLLLTTYSEIVGIEREKLKKVGMEFEPTPLPIDTDEIAEMDGEEPLTFAERRMEAAITAYVTGEGNNNEIASMYGVPRQAFRDEIKRRGLSRPRGGDVRKYRKPAHREEG